MEGFGRTILCAFGYFKSLEEVLCTIKHQRVVPRDLLAAQELAYGLLGLTYSNLVHEAESQGYGACSFDVVQKHIKFREVFEHSHL